MAAAVDPELAGDESPGGGGAGQRTAGFDPRLRRAAAAESFSLIP
jgi:hypothetical protein